MLDPLEFFGLRTARRRHELSVPGSPERCVSRSVLEDTSGRLWLLERLAARQTPRREAIAAVLQALQDRFPAQDRAMIPAFRKSSQGGRSAEIAGMRWQLSPYVLSDELPRPDYLGEAARGASLAGFMLAFQDASRALPPTLLNDLAAAQRGLPELSAYAADLLATTHLRSPDTHAVLERLFPRLETAMTQCRALPMRLQHGDLHPLNVLWQGRDAVAVIDWEFLGLKPEVYDLANLLGCLGFEHPDGLTGPLALRLTETLRNAGYLAPGAWELLPECTALLRLAWLSEWLRKKERDLVDMELEYMKLLLDRADGLRRAWTG
ncbi:phosphotransferase [Paucidesulfovibrio longus]|uniref:phosphotransferase n=1 Tax=Paucidesulfovibrio longus TaxID=889 RepID=UPI0003B53598|nr:phosphotransferase [Paucidesulfovibrio longus]